MSIRKTLRKHPLVWRYAYNAAPTAAFICAGKKSHPERGRTVSQLSASGIAVTSARTLGVQSLFGELEKEVRDLEHRREAELNQVRRNADNASNSEHKSFLVQLLSSRPMLDPTSVFARFALTAGLEVANGYFGMLTRLREYNVWHNFPVRGGPRASQLWHRDREDRLILKMFVYLSDVDESAGPFTYAPGTHAKGPIRNEPAGTVEQGVRRTNDDQMATVVPREKWFRATAPKGTIIFADTAGYHKGGYCTGKERLLYVAMFTSPASESAELFQRTDGTETAASLATRVALMPGRRGPWLRL